MDFQPKQRLARIRDRRQVHRIAHAQITPTAVGRFRLRYKRQPSVDRLLEGFFGAIRDLRENIRSETLLGRYARLHRLTNLNRRLLWKAYLREADVTGEWT